MAVDTKYSQPANTARTAPAVLPPTFFSIPFIILDDGYKIANYTTILHDEVVVIKKTYTSRHCLMRLDCSQYLLQNSKFEDTTNVNSP